MKTTRAKLLLLLFFVVAMPLAVLADPPALGGDDVDDVPVDGGLSLLVAAGVSYGIKKYKHINKTRK